MALAGLCDAQLHQTRNILRNWSANWRRRRLRLKLPSIPIGAIQAATVAVNVARNSMTIQILRDTRTKFAESLCVAHVIAA